ncbi:hypothetical protein [Cetobacterium sp.]
MRKKSKTTCRSGKGDKNGLGGNNFSFRVIELYLKQLINIEL